LISLIGGNPLNSGYAATPLMAYILLFQKHTRQAKKIESIRSTGSTLRSDRNEWLFILAV